MALLTRSELQAPDTVCPPARQSPAPAPARGAIRREQLARAHRAGRLLVDATAKTDREAVVIAPRAVADAILGLIGLPA